MAPAHDALVQEHEAAVPEAPGAPADSSSKPKSLFDELGGAAAVKAAVELFYSKVLADPDLSPFFEGLDMAKQRAKQIKFLSFALGGPDNYQGRSMGEAHRELVEKKGLRNLHFDKVLQHLGATLQELGVPQETTTRAAAIVESTRASFGFPC